jgi:PST family polysaccharide transporter
MTAREVWQGTSPLLKLGFAFMVSGVLMMGSAYAVRAMVLRMVGVDGAGFYQAAWTLGGLYVGFILQAMGADFYPRLTAIASDNGECNRLVNEQAQVSLLLAGPGVLTTLAFAPIAVRMFYSADFHAAVGLLQWFCLGMTLRVITWPMGFILLAKGRANLMIGTQLAWAIVNVGLSWFCVSRVELNGAGVAFFGSYIFHGLMLYPIVRQLSGFRWSAANVRTGAIFLALIAGVFGGSCILPIPWSVIIGAGGIVVSCAYSVRVLLNLLPAEQIPLPVRRVLALMGVAGWSARA